VIASCIEVKSEVSIRGRASWVQAKLNDCRLQNQGKENYAIPIERLEISMVCKVRERARRRGKPRR
jgi:hypothetical protein